MKLMVLSMWKSLARSHTCAMEFVIRIVHLITTEHCFQATLIKGLVVSHKRKPLNQWFNLFPDLWEHWGLLCVLSSQAMYLSTPVIIIVGLWLDQRVEGIYGLTITHYHHSNRADTDERSLLAVSKSIAAKSRICRLYICSTCFWQSQPPRHGTIGAPAPQCRYPETESPGGSRRWGEV